MKKFLCLVAFCHLNKFGTLNNELPSLYFLLCFILPLAKNMKLAHLEDVQLDFIHVVIITDKMQNIFFI